MDWNESTVLLCVFEPAIRRHEHPVAVNSSSLALERRSRTLKALAHNAARATVFGKAKGDSVGAAHILVHAREFQNTVDLWLLLRRSDVETPAATAISELAYRGNQVNWYLREQRLSIGLYTPAKGFHAAAPNSTTSTRDSVRASARRSPAQMAELRRRMSWWRWRCLRADNN